MMRETPGTTGEVLSFDGKTLCSAAKRGSRDKLHVVSAYLTQSGVVPGQKTVDGKTNGIPVVQEMPKYPDIKGRIITADAVHCRKETVSLIRKGEADYILSLKKNQETFCKELSEYLDYCISSEEAALETAETVEITAGRIETRVCYKSPALD
jgi:hypothetical protein